MLYKGLMGAAGIPTDDFVPPSKHIRKHHSLAFPNPQTATGIFEGTVQHRRNYLIIDRQIRQCCVDPSNFISVSSPRLIETGIFHGLCC